MQYEWNGQEAFYPFWSEVSGGHSRGVDFVVEEYEEACRENGH